MTWLIAVLLYLAIGVGCVIVGEHQSRKYPEHDGALTPAGFILITVAWPVLIAAIWLDVQRKRRKDS